MQLQQYFLQIASGEPSTRHHATAYSKHVGQQERRMTLGMVPAKTQYHVLHSLCLVVALVELVVLLAVTGVVRVLVLCCVVVVVVVVVVFV